MIDKNLIKSVAKIVVKCIPFLCVWYVIFIIISLANSQGSLSVFEDVFGNWILMLGIVIITGIVTSIFYLRVFIKKEWLIQVIAFSLTIIFAIGSLLLSNFCDTQFREFSTPKWINYPQRRLTMYFDLRNRYDISGFSTNEIEILLGMPDKIDDNCYIDGIKNKVYIYDDRHGNMVYVYFVNNKATDLGYSE